MNKKFFLALFLIVPAYIHPSPPGQHFILTLPETFDQKQLSEWLTKTKPAGVMLLAFHCQERSKTKTLTSFLQQEAKGLGIPPLFISIDWEGGIVSRPTEVGGFYSAPGPWALANAGVSSCFLAGMLIGSQCRDVGINVNFAPSLDLFDPHNHILGSRCFSADPQTVAMCGIAFSQGLMEQGVLPVIKHFPGLGLGKGDTHHAGVQIEANKQSLDNNLFPFKQALRAGIPLVMSTHACFKQFGPMPVTLSPIAVKELKTLNPDVLLVTDDFSMKGVQENKSVHDAALQASNAGYDLIIFSGKPETQVALMESLQNIANNPTKTINHVKAKYLQTKKSYFPIDEKQLSAELGHRCIQLHGTIPTITEHSVVLFTVDLPKIRTPEKWFIKEGKSALARLLEQKGISVTEHILNAKDCTSPQDLKELIDGIKETDWVVLQSFFYANDAWNVAQKEWLSLLKPLQKKLTVVSLGHPTEQQHLPQASFINLGSFHMPLLTRAVEVLCQGPTLTGADRLVKNPSAYLKGKRVGLVCHQCSVAHLDSKEVFLPDYVKSWTAKNPSSRLAALFTPEHGLSGTAEAGASIASETNSRYKCPIYSLHGKQFKPTPDMLKNLDLLIFDLQEVGVRCFTYLSTMQLVLEAAAEQSVPVLVLDRPNPLETLPAQGPLLEKRFESFLGKLSIPFMHGSSMGHLAEHINNGIGADLTVLHNQNFSDSYFNQPWIAPSPNLASIEQLFAYPATVFIEGTNYSEGRGTHQAFLQIGAPWVDKKDLANRLNAQHLPGIYFQPIDFKPAVIPGMAENPKHKNIACHGVFVHIVERTAIKPTQTAFALLRTLFTMYPEQSTWLNHSTLWQKERYGIDLLSGSDKWRIEINACTKS